MIRAAKAKMAAAKKEATRLAKNPNLHKIPGEEEDEYTEKKDNTFGLGNNFDGTGMEHDDYANDGMKRVADLSPDEKSAMTKDEIREMEADEKRRDAEHKKKILADKRRARDDVKDAKKAQLVRYDSDGNEIEDEGALAGAAPMIMVCVIIFVVIAAVVAVFALGLVEF